MSAEWIQVVVTFMVAQISLIGVEWFRSWLLRDQRRRDARDEFQKRTLIELQEALYSIVRGISNSISEYELLRVGKPAPVWPAAEDPRIIGAGAFARIDALTERVYDREVRELVEQFILRHQEMFSVSKDSDLETAVTHRDGLRESQKQVNKRIGELLRGM